MKYKPWPPIIILALISLLGIVCVFFYYYPSQESLRAISSNDFTISAIKYTNPLDGTVAKSKNDSMVQVVGVIVDNHPDARPESGIAKAKIVYEAPVEGGLTRYLAIFDNKQVVAEVGPVRSARAYFLDWLQEYGNGLYMHSGGSPEALDLIKTRKIFDANEFFWGQYYWRDEVRFAPHNLYTNSENWQKIVLSPSAREGVGGSGSGTNSLFTTDKAWKYSKLIGKTMASSGGLTIPFSTDYSVVWTYDAKALNYSRSLDGAKEIDKNGATVTARNILVQITDVSDIANDDKGRQAVTTVGGGDAIILKKGSVTYGTWKKKNLADRTRFYDKNKKEVVLVPGNTWVEVVPATVNVQVSN